MERVIYTSIFKRRILEMKARGIFILDPVTGTVIKKVFYVLTG